MTDENEGLTPVQIREIFEYLPHRYPFLMIDRVVECRPGSSIVAVKNVSVNEPYFQGHFPGRPILPGVLILEAFAQAAGILAFKSVDARPEEDMAYYMVGIDNARFRDTVTPGDQLTLHVTLGRTIRSIWKFSGTARVGGKEVAAADVMVAVAFGDETP